MCVEQENEKIFSSAFDVLLLCLFAARITRIIWFGTWLDYRTSTRTILSVASLIWAPAQHMDNKNIVHIIEST